MKYALDTNIVTYYLKGNEKILDRVDQEAKNDNIIIPPFVYFEIKKWLMAVNSKIKLQAFEKLFEKFGIDAIEKQTMDLSLSIYIKLRQQGITVDDGDLLIAAYCIQNKYTLVSNNQKHFEKIENIQVVNWTI
jgi:tRNA(fMet)-specific endonuclease VapC